MPHMIDDVDGFLAGENVQDYRDESDFFFALDHQTANPEEINQTVVKKTGGKPPVGGRPPRPPLRSLVAKAFITTCRDRALQRTRSFPFLRESPDKRSLLSEDANSVPFNFDDSSEFTADLMSDSSINTAPPATVPKEHRRLKKHVKVLKSRVSRSLRNVLAKRQYRTMPDELFGGIEVPLHQHELMVFWNNSNNKGGIYRNPYEARDDLATRGDQVSNTQWPPAHAPQVMDFAAHSPSRTAMTKDTIDGTTANTAKQPSMTVCYDNDCAQLVFGDDIEGDDTPFDEDTNVDSGSLSPSDEESSVPVSTPTSSPGRPLGVSFSHPAFLKKQIAEKSVDYGDLWENLGDPPLDGENYAHPTNAIPRRNTSPLRQVSPNRRSNTSQRRVPVSQCRYDVPFDETVSDKVVERDSRGNELGFEIVPKFDKVLKMPSMGEKPRPAKPLAIKNRPVCHCVKCSAKSIYADLYTC